MKKTSAIPVHRWIVALVSGLALLSGCSSEGTGEPQTFDSGLGVPGGAPTVLVDPTYFSGFVQGRCCTVIAHAGGAIDGNSYTNSTEAVERNYALGTRVFELDFQKTADGHWVAAHDWPSWKGRTRFKGDLPPDLATFESLQRKYPRTGWSIKAEYSPMTFAWLEGFLDQHPDASVVTDIKELEEFSDLVDAVLSGPVGAQFIFQAYRIHQVDYLKERDPSARVILTLYRLRFYEGLFDDIADRRNALLGVTAPMNFEPASMSSLIETGVPIYLHGGPSNINSRALQADFAARGVSGFYLD